MTAHSRGDFVGLGAQLLGGVGVALAARPGAKPAAAGRLPGVVSLRDTGAVGDGRKDDTAAIRRAFKRLGELRHGGILYAPPGEYITRGGHVLRPWTQLVGAGVGTTLFRHVGAGSCFTLTGPGITEHRAGIGELSIQGGSAPGAAGVEFRDLSFGAWARNVRVRDYKAGIGFLLNNFASRQYNEGVMLVNCSSTNCATGITLRRVGGTESFKGFFTSQFGCNVPAGGRGFDFGVGGELPILVYNCELHGHIWFDRNENNIGWDVGARALLRDGSAWISGEGSSKTSVSIRNRAGGQVALFGQWWFNQIPHAADLSRTKIGPLTSASLGV
ncbi:MAG: glycosyl hydrolase family 28-related protein [Gaiella sp.]